MDCGQEESCSDHELILFDIEAGTSGCNVVNYARTRYQTKHGDWGKSENKLLSNLLSQFNCINNYNDPLKCDEELSEKAKQFIDTGISVEV